MNPFLHNPVASIPALPARPIASRVRRPRRLRWPRAIGTLALAAGLSLAAMPARALDVNTATIDQLRAVRGVGPKTAETIVKERERGGRFESMEDLSDRVRGIGSRRAQALEAAGLRVDRAALPAGVRGDSSRAGATGAAPSVPAPPAPGRKGTEAKEGGKEARTGRQAPRGTR
jgi:competence protein ComEA